MKKNKHGYLHGYSEREQKRLLKQAHFLESYVYEDVNLKSVHRLLEVGCGVGAQTKILLKRFPLLKVTGVDASSQQISQAQKYLEKSIRRGQAEFFVQDAAKLLFRGRSFDGAFLCWFLEHVPEPVKILREVRRVLKPGSVIYCSEVQNASLFVEPYSPAILKYWFEYNDEQWLMKGDPFIGAKLGNLLKDAGFKNIETRVKPFMFDSRQSRQRAEFIKYWTDLLLSGVPALLKSKRVTKNLVAKMTREMAVIRKSKKSAFFYTWVQARGQA